MKKFRFSRLIIASTWLFCLIFLMLLPFVELSPVSGQTDDNDWDDVEKRQEEIDTLKETIEDLEEAVRKQETEAREVAEELKEAEQRLEEAEKELASAQENLEIKREVFGGRVRSAYMGQSFSYLEMLFGADNLGDLVLRLEYLSRIFRQERMLLEDMRSEREKAESYAEKIEDDRDRVATLYREEKEKAQRLREMRKEKEEVLYAAKDELKEQLAQISTRAEAPPVYGVVIDNFRTSRPQFGLAEAQRVYEYEVEGEITRYLALYADFPSKVGPLRSARVHSATLAMENNVLLAYAGAAGDVEKKLDQLGVNRVNALNLGRGFSRSSDAYPPYNLFANLSTLGLVPPPDRSEIRPVQPEKEGGSGENISLVYNNFTNIEYRYDPVDNLYHRYLNGAVHRDAQGNPIQPRNVVKQHVSFTRDERGRPTADLLGEGEIDFYSSGRHLRGTWSKESPSSPTRFYYEDGTPIEIPYGKTWIQLVAS